MSEIQDKLKGIIDSTRRYNANHHTNRRVALNADTAGAVYAELARLRAALDAAVVGLNAAARVLARPEYFDALQAEAYYAVTDALDKANSAHPAAPAPTAQPAAEEGVDLAQRITYAHQALKNAASHIAMIEDNRTACALEQYGYAITNLIEALITQKGETQS